MGCYLINSEGERFMERYHPLGERAERAFLTWGIYSEMRAGRGPCYVDARHLGKEDQERLLETLVVDKGPFGDYLRQKGIDLSKDSMEVSISEFHAQCGILVNEECETPVRGLFAAGEGTGSTGVSRVAAEGYRAGRNAARLSMGVALGRIPSELLENEKTRIYVPLRTDGIAYLEFEQKIRELMSAYVGFERTENSMKKALTLLDALKPLTQRIKAENYHYLLRALECVNIYLVARLVTIASIQRKETRWGGNLICPRGDYPNPNPEWAKKVVVLRRGERNDHAVNVEIRDLRVGKEEVIAK
jgi:succinate dehydrogenase/fumarate reductase flavoprotein subunit